MRSSSLRARRSAAGALWRFRRPAADPDSLRGCARAARPAVRERAACLRCRSACLSLTLSDALLSVNTREHVCLVLTEHWPLSR